MYFVNIQHINRQQNIQHINRQHNVLYYGLVMNNVCVTSCYELEMLDEHTASLFNLLICNKSLNKSK